MPKAEPLAVRFWRHVRKTRSCWHWTGAVDAGGYGRVGRDSSEGRGTVAAHRAAYELLVGPIPDGLDLDHTCHDPNKCKGGRTCPHRRCVNPAHLEPVERVTNLQRGTGSLDRCAQGHPYTPANTYRSPTHGRRNCRTCNREKQRRRRLHARR